MSTEKYHLVHYSLLTPHSSIPPHCLSHRANVAVSSLAFSHKRVTALSGSQ
jgi:hypothetical protein